MTLKINDECIVDIRSIGSGGEGVGTFDGLVCFIEGALPGETVRACVTLLKKSYFKATLLEILKPSSDRVQPICPVFGKCGGCQIMHLSYEAQLNYKKQHVEETLKRIGGFQSLPISSCVASPDPLYYRNKIQLPVLYKNNAWIMGLYARGSHDIIPVKKCFIHSAVGEKVFAAANSLLKLMPAPHRGKIRHLLLRTAVHEQKVLVVIITTGIEKSWLREFAEKLMEAESLVHGVIENINTRADNVILGTRYETIKGVSTIEETLLGLKFRLSPHAFFQVNTAQVEQLYKAVMEMAELTGQEIVVDAYCGVGTMALIAASRAKKVIGIEYVADAIEDARHNAIRNQIANAVFEVGAAEKRIASIDKMDVVILNPPRKGCAEELLQELIRKKPSRVVYVSCNPATLSRDLQQLSKTYRIEEIIPFDMFPQTSRVETVVKLSLINTKDC